jgi:hypothetical protein
MSGRARADTPVAMPVPLEREKRRAPVKFGTYEGEIVIPEDFDAPDREIIDMFQNSGPIFPRRRGI